MSGGPPSGSGGRAASLPKHGVALPTYYPVAGPVLSSTPSWRTGARTDRVHTYRMARRRESLCRRAGDFGRARVTDWQYPDGRVPDAGSAEEHEFSEAVYQHLWASDVREHFTRRGVDMNEDDLPPDGVARMERVVAGRKVLRVYDLVWSTLDLGIPAPTGEQLSEALAQARRSARLALLAQPARLPDAGVGRHGQYAEFDPGRPVRRTDQNAIRSGDSLQGRALASIFRDLRLSTSSR